MEAPALLNVSAGCGFLMYPSQMSFEGPIKNPITNLIFESFHHDVEARAYI